jgi:hypothetical protein
VCERERGGQRERKETSFKCGIGKSPIKVSLQSCGLEHNTDKNLNAGSYLLTLSIACHWNLMLNEGSLNRGSPVLCNILH